MNFQPTTMTYDQMIDSIGLSKYLPSFAYETRKNESFCDSPISDEKDDDSRYFTSDEQKSIEALAMAIKKRVLEPTELALLDDIEPTVGVYLFMGDLCSRQSKLVCEEVCGGLGCAVVTLDGSNVTLGLRDNLMYLVIYDVDFMVGQDWTTLVKYCIARQTKEYRISIIGVFTRNLSLVNCKFNLYVHRHVIVFVEYYEHSVQQVKLYGWEQRENWDFSKKTKRVVVKSTNLLSVLSLRKAKPFPKSQVCENPIMDMFSSNDRQTDEFVQHPSYKITELYRLLTSVIELEKTAQKRHLSSFLGNFIEQSRISLESNCWKCIIHEYIIHVVGLEQMGLIKTKLKLMKNKLLNSEEEKDWFSVVVNELLRVQIM